MFTYAPLEHIKFTVLRSRLFSICPIC